MTSAGGGHSSILSAKHMNTALRSKGQKKDQNLIWLGNLPWDGRID